MGVSRAQIVARALVIAESELGHGEVKNNRGPDIERYRTGDGTGIGPGGKGAWCAAYASYCDNQAAIQLETRLAYRTSRSAKKLGENIAKAGRRIDPKDIKIGLDPAFLVGATIVWHRFGMALLRAIFDRHGHVGKIVSWDPTTDTMITNEGNKRKKGAKLAYANHFTYPRGAWRKRLYLITIPTPK